MISELHINNFRNILSAKMECSPRFNLFFGDNGTGKTSILEAIHCISTGKSFRTNNHSNLIHHAHDEFTLFVNLLHNKAKISIGMQRSQDNNLLMKLNEERVPSVLAISPYVPVQFIGSATYRILTDGPKIRRQFLDWGLFYTQSTFYETWKSFQKLLTQRNAALKARASQDEMVIWNHEIAIVGEALDNMRHEYIVQFAPFFQQIAGILLEKNDIELNYSKGWPSHSSLIACLSENLFREYQLGYTLYGPHRANLILSVNNLPVQEVLSQGQQKLIAYALRLAQGLQFQASLNQSPIYLIDDLPSELDPKKRSLVTEILATLQAQVFITGIACADLTQFLAIDRAANMFHVKHGAISKTEKEKCFT